MTSANNVQIAAFTKYAELHKVAQFWGQKKVMHAVSAITDSVVQTWLKKQGNTTLISPNLSTNKTISFRPHTQQNNAFWRNWHYPETQERSTERRWHNNYFLSSSNNCAPYVSDIWNLRVQLYNLRETRGRGALSLHPRQLFVSFGCSRRGVLIDGSTDRVTQVSSSNRQNDKSNCWQYITNKQCISFLTATVRWTSQFHA
jgi:hypothetical protein